MIQGKFYQRLHFYTDSCAISPTASHHNKLREKGKSIKRNTKKIGRKNEINLQETVTEVSILYL